MPRLLFIGWLLLLVLLALIAGSGFTVWAALQRLGVMRLWRRRW